MMSKYVQDLSAASAACFTTSHRLFHWHPVGEPLWSCARRMPSPIENNAAELMGFVSRMGLQIGHWICISYSRISREAGKQWETTNIIHTQNPNFSMLLVRLRWVLLYGQILICPEVPDSFAKVIGGHPFYLWRRIFELDPRRPHWGLTWGFRCSNPHCLVDPCFDRVDVYI